MFKFCEILSKFLTFLVRFLGSRFKLEKYSRSERAKRSRDQIAVNLNISKITNYFPILNQVEILIEQNKVLRYQLSIALEPVRTDCSKISDNFPDLLKLLAETAMKTGTKKQGGERYKECLRLFSSYIFVMAGRQSYDLLQKNLPGVLPSIASVLRTMKSSADVIQEGEFRFLQLKEYLESRGFPKKVSKLEYKPISSL